MDPGNSMVKVYRKVNQTFKAIAAAFKNAKDANLCQFLHDLEDQANVYMEKLSAERFPWSCAFDTYYRWKYKNQTIQLK